MTCEKVTTYFKSQDLSGEDIVTLTGRQPVLYSDLGKYSSVQELLGKAGYAVIMYQTSSISTGHFVALYIRFDGVLCYADSYGLVVDTEQALGATFDQRFPPLLSALIEKSGMKYEYNHIDYQSKHPGVSTCGRFASFFCLTGRHLTFLEIQTFLNRNNDSFLTADNIVTLLTMFPLRDIRSFFDRTR